MLDVLIHTSHCESQGPAEELLFSVFWLAVELGLFTCSLNSPWVQKTATGWPKTRVTEQLVSDGGFPAWDSKLLSWKQVIIFCDAA